MYAVVERSSVEKFQSGFVSKDSFTMGQQHRPVFRKRSLAELPGNIRVPVFKKSDRLKSRLEASLAGLRELQSLREKHEMMVTEAMTSLQSPTIKQNEDKSATEFSFEVADIHGNGATKQYPESGHKPRSSISGESNSVFDGADTPIEAIPTPSRQNSEDSDGTVKEAECIPKDNDDKGSESIQNDNTVSDKSDKTSPKSHPDKQFRPRSMSLSHFPSSRKTTVERSSSVSRVATDALPSTEGPGSRKKRKESIFEGVDINIQGPNPVHAILMQYGPLSSTQSMPSVCPNITRHHSALQPKTVPIGLSQSDQSSSTNSVFSTTETLTSATQTEDLPKNESVDTKGPVARFLETDIDLVLANNPVEGHSIKKNDDTSSKTNLKMHKKNETLNSTANKDLLATKISTTTCDIALKKDHREANRQQTRKDSYRKIVETREQHYTPVLTQIPVPEAKSTLSVQHDSPNLEHVTRRQHPQCKSETALELNFKVETSKHVKIEDCSRTKNVSKVQHDCPIDLKETKNSQNKEISNSINNTNNRLTRSTSNITNTQRRNHEVRAVPCNKTSTLPYQSAQSLSTSISGDGPKKIRRFGMPLDSKLMKSLLHRQEKLQPIRIERREVASAPSVNSPSCRATKHGKENGRPLRQSSYTEECSDDDEYGMARLLEPRRRLTSTPVLSTRRSSTVPRLSCVSDEGYCPSHNSSQGQGHRGQSTRRHKLSFKSDRTWISSDLEDSGICSGELSPFSPISPSGPRFNFSEFPPKGHRGPESSSSSVIHSPVRSSPDWDSFSHRSSVSVYSLSTDVQESSL